ncbi:hypothetical protein HK103_001686 [Boothiomyces macroporosus]|uniref:Uncharacterized protein n=1 Tax=Boothiomyces macroporosus TaxID=261099 RepID=A0AAD5UJG8_9FUNG|nr:hypothetical protein HK103_001686 [Boothiomyces macroporosus]
MPKSSFECKADIIVQNSAGASNDILNFYSTVNSTTYLDSLPHLQSKFTLHLNSKPKETHNRVSHDRIRKQQTGYSKNCVPYVAYDKEIDEKEQKYSEEAFITCHAAVYKPRAVQEDKFGKTEFVTQEIRDSGFTTIPKYNVTSQGKNYEQPTSEMKDKFVPAIHTKPAKFDKSKIKPSSSAYTSDVEHFKEFGDDTESPFEKLEVKVLESKVSDIKYPNLMKSNGYTNSVRFGVVESDDGPEGVYTEDQLEHMLRNDPTKWMRIHANKKSTSRYGISNTSRFHCDLSPMAKTLALRTQNIKIGAKEETGSIRNNRAYTETINSDPNLYTSETSEK